MFCLQSCDCEPARLEDTNHATPVVERLLNNNALDGVFLVLLRRWQIVLDAMCRSQNVSTY